MQGSEKKSTYAHRTIATPTSEHMFPPYTHSLRQLKGHRSNSGSPYIRFSKTLEFAHTLGDIATWIDGDLSHSVWVLHPRENRSGIKRIICNVRNTAIYLSIFVFNALKYTPSTRLVMARPDIHSTLSSYTDWRGGRDVHTKAGQWMDICDVFHHSDTTRTKCNVRCPSVQLVCVHNTITLLIILSTGTRNT